MSEELNSSIFDKLKSMGVRLGPTELPENQKSVSFSVEEVLDGQAIPTPQGDIFLVEQNFPRGQALGESVLEITAQLDKLAQWAGEPRLKQLPPEAFAFIDTETTGLSGGTGTYAFLIGVGRFEEDQFHLAQFFMRDPSEEPAQLLALEQFLAPCETIVTFNGKAFDVPLLQSRFSFHGWRSPFQTLSHIDLLHLARRLWRDRLPSRTLGNLEVQILGADRNEQDVPGWMIPSIYFDYLRDGDARPLKSVFYHNAMDVVSMSALLNHMAALLSAPIQLGNRYSVDLISLARLFEDMQDLDTATDLYIHGLEHKDSKEMRLPKEILLKALQRLALIYKRQKKLSAAMQLWEQAASHQHLESYVELAKCYEHQYQDYQQAIHWTVTAIEIVKDSSSPGGSNLISSAFQRQQWLVDLEHRLHRLYRKLSETT